MRSTTGEEKKGGKTNRLRINLEILLEQGKTELNSLPICLSYSTASKKKTLLHPALGPKPRHDYYCNCKMFNNDLLTGWITNCPSEYFGSELSVSMSFRKGPLRFGAERWRVETEDRPEEFGGPTKTSQHPKHHPGIGLQGLPVIGPSQRKKELPRHDDKESKK